MTAPAQTSTAPVGPAPDERARRSWLYRPEGIWAVRIVTFILLIGFWELSAQDVSRALFAPPSEVLQAFYQLVFVQGAIHGALIESLITLTLGLVLCVAAGIPLGLAMGRSRTLEWALDPYVTFLYVLPSVAFIPLLVVWLGFDLQMRVALVFLSGVFPMIINTMVGVKHVDPELVDGGRAFTATPWQIMRTIIVPATLPFMFAGLRIAFSAAWVGVIVAEMTALITGIGGLILHYANLFRTANVLVPILFIMAVGVFIQWFSAWLQRRMTPWHVERQDAGM